MQPDTTSNQPSNHPGKSAVFYVAGGYGKNLIATVPVRELARRGYRVQVIASHPRAWIGNPYVERIHPIGGTYLHEAIAAADALVHDNKSTYERPWDEEFFALPDDLREQLLEFCQPDFDRYGYTPPEKLEAPEELKHLLEPTEPL